MSGSKERCQHCKKKLREGQVVLPLLKVGKQYEHDIFLNTSEHPVAYIHITCIERRYYDH